jgi:hypothetical protein
MQGHVDGLLMEMGRVDSVVRSSVSERFRGSPEHVLITYVRGALTVIVCVLASFGVARRARRGRLDATAVAVALAPMAMFPLQSYGGEMALRVYFVALPMMALLVARLFFSDAVLTASKLARIAAVCASLGLTFAFLLARYGNERMDFYTREEVQAIQHFHRAVQQQQEVRAISDGPLDPPLVLLPSWNSPIRFERDELYRYYTIESPRDPGLTILRSADVDRLLQDVSPIGGEAYYISTRSQKAQLDLMYGLPPSAVDRFTQEMMDSGKAIPIFRNRDVTILRLTQTALRATQ